MKKPQAVTVINFVDRGFVITGFGPGTMNILKIIIFFLVFMVFLVVW